MDRRRLLKGAAAAAASLVVAGSLTQRDIREAKAASFHDLSGTASTEYGIGVEGMSSEGHGVQGTNAADDPDNAAVYGRNGGPGGGTSVQGDSLVGNGVVGNGGGVGNGVVGDGGYGGRAGLPGAGVLGRNILIAARDAGDLGGVSNQPLGVGAKGGGTLSGVEGHAMGEGFDYAFNESGVAAAGGVGVLGRDINVNRGVGVQGESPNLGVKGTS